MHIEKENSGVYSCSRQNYYMTYKDKHRSTTAPEKILLDLHHHIARLAWLIQEYLFLVKKLSGSTLKIEKRYDSLSHHLFTHLVLFI